MQRFDDLSVRLREDITPAIWRDGVKDIAEHLCLPAVSEKAMQGLKFSAALPARLAEATLAARSVDLAGATAILAEPVRFVSEL
jgi:ATP-dependent Lhr-like helicase